MAGYIGDIPVPQATQTRQTFTATASQTSFPTLGYTAGFIDVYLNGVKILDGVDYTATNGSDVVLTTGAALNDILEVTIFDTFTTSSATFSGTTTFADGGNIITATAGTDNVRLGENAGNSIASGGNNNVTIGKDAGTALTTGDNNVAVGFEALKTEDANGNSTAIGYRALKTQNAGAEAYNVAVGVDAGTAITTATRNTVVGSSAGSSNQTSLYNTYVGYGAGQSTTGQGNTFIGDVSGNSVVAGEFNTLLGQQAGNAITSGNKNTVIGRFNGNQNSLDLTTSSNNIMLSDGDGNPRFWINSNGAVSATANGVTHPTGTQSYHMFQNSAAATYTLMARNGSASPGAHYMSELNFTGAAPNNTTAKFLQCRDSGGAKCNIESNGDLNNTNQVYGALSDEKLKENIVDSGSQWDDIKAVKVRKYSFKADELDAANRIGVIAQELEASGMNGLVDTQKDLDLETREDLGTETKSVKYSVLYMKAIKALQEAMARIETLETKVATLEAE